MPATHPVKITVLVNKDEFDRFSAYCEFQGHKKSTLIARLIREHLDAANFRTQRTLPLGSMSGSAK